MKALLFVHNLIKRILFLILLSSEKCRVASSFPFCFENGSPFSRRISLQHANAIADDKLCGFS